MYVNIKHRVLYIDITPSHSRRICKLDLYPTYFFIKPSPKKIRCALVFHRWRMSATLRARGELSEERLKTASCLG